MSEENTAIVTRQPLKALTRQELCGKLGLTIEAVKQHYAPGATDQEFAIYIDQAAACNLDPRKGEIHFVKYGNQKASCITAYNTYIQRAERTGLLNGWNAELIQNDQGQVIAARVTIHRKDWDQPFIWDVARGEFDKGQSSWKVMPGFMLKKVCIAQAFRLAFPEELGGLPYTTDELSTYADEGTVQQAIDVTSGPELSVPAAAPPVATPPPPPAQVTPPPQPARVQAPVATPPPPPPPPPAQAPAPPAAPPAPPVQPQATQGAPQVILSEEKRQKVYGAFAQYQITAVDLAQIAGDASVWTEVHRLWLLDHFKKIKAGTLPVDSFRAMKFAGEDF